jgi:hypothetical protein
MATLLTGDPVVLVQGRVRGSNVETFDHLRAAFLWLQQRVGWIRVSDSMPDDDVIVLVAMPDAPDEPTWFGHHDGDDGWRVQCPAGWGPPPAPVKFWMHLPESPDTGD